MSYLKKSTISTSKLNVSSMREGILSVLFIAIFFAPTRVCGTEQALHKSPLKECIYMGYKAVRLLRQCISQSCCILKLKWVYFLEIL